MVPPTSYDEAYNRVMDIECDSKTSKGKQRASDDDSTDESSNGESKTVQALQKDMLWMMQELKADKESGRDDKELWCTDCKAERHTKGTCSRKAFCDICQVLGHSIKECSYNLKTRSTQVLYTQGEQATRPATPPKQTSKLGGFHQEDTAIIGTGTTIPIITCQGAKFSTMQKGGL